MKQWNLRMISLVASILIVLVSILILRPILSIEEPGPLLHEIEIYIPCGACLTRIAQILQDNGAVDQACIFRWQVKLYGMPEKLQAGYYKFPPRVSAQKVMDMLQNGAFEMTLVTVPEGLTHKQIQQLMEALPDLHGNVVHMPREGWLLPETYKVPKGSSPQMIINEMHQSMRRFLATEIACRSVNTTLSPEEIIVLASVVEKETCCPEERRRISQLFLNRLRRNMRLQADPTVVYAISEGLGKLNRPLSREDLKVDLPHNTYVHKGLPATAISNPGKASIRAVLRPAETRDLYFVADGTGKHRFAPTLTAHTKNVFKLRHHVSTSIAR